jgi:hypothetical protein
LLVATTRPSPRPQSDLSPDYRLAWWSQAGLQRVALPDDQQGVVDAAVRPGGSAIVAIVGGTRLLRTDEEGHSPSDLQPRLAGAQPADVQAYLSVTWAGPARLLVRQAAPAGIFLIDANGQSRTPLGLNGLDPAVSPDGRHLALADAADRPYLSIFVADEPFQTATKLTTDEVGEAAPAWSPDGTWIAYATRASARAGQSVSSELRIVRIDGTEDQTIIAARPGVSYANLAWSPDGARIGFTRYQELTHSRRIGIVNRDGTRELAISDAQANDRLLAWVN